MPNLLGGVKIETLETLHENDRDVDRIGEAPRIIFPSLLETVAQLLFCHPEPGPEHVSGSTDFRVSYVLDFVRC
jgi:hypothetical protein